MRLVHSLMIFRGASMKNSVIICILCFVAIIPVASASKENRIRLIGKRDPFWPVGYIPEHLIKKEVTVEKVKPVSVVGSWSLAMKTIVINGVSSRSGDDFFAVINGEIKSVGDSVSVKYGDAVYTWTVDSIKPPRSVKLRRVSVQ